MALWRVVYEYEDGRRETHVVAAGNREAAEARATRFAAGRGARLVDGPTVQDSVRGTL